MAPHFRPETALAPGTVERCYRGGLTREAKALRLQTCAVLLLVGRLGLRPGELQHLHGGWVDWERGFLHVPARDPCACEHCWERARVRQRAGDGRPLADVVAAECWRPPEGAGRTVDFGWSQRLTGVLASALDAWPYFGCDVARMHSLLRSAGEAADVDDPAALTVGALRASAADFMADAGLSRDQLGAALGVEPAEVADFCDDTAAPRARSPDDGSGASSAADDRAYPLLTDAEALDREPFDPATYDAAWRREREANREPSPGRSPRPTEVPAGVTYDPPRDALPSYPDRTPDDHPADDGLLARWAGGDGESPAETVTSPPDADRDTGRARGDGATAQPGAASPSGGADGAGGADATGERTVAGAESRTGTAADPLEGLTEPVRLDVSTRFACEAIHGGRPAGGTVVLAQSELVLVTHGDGENVAHEVIPLHAVTDVAVGYCPDALADVFDETLGVAYERGGGRRVAVVELAADDRRRLASVLFARRLDGCAAVVTHPAREGGLATDAVPWNGVLAVDAGRIAGAPGRDEDPRFQVRLADVVGVERGRNRHDGAVYHGLDVRYVGSTGETVTTTITPVDEDDRDVFVRFLEGDCRRRASRVRSMDLPAAHEDVLRALAPGQDGVTISALLERGPDDLTDVLDSLESAGLLRVAADGPRLTGAGLSLVEETVDDGDA